MGLAAAEKVFAAERCTVFPVGTQVFSMEHNWTHNTVRTLGSTQDYWIHATALHISE